MKKSVCVATYNGAEFIVRQLDSVLKQFDHGDEVIVIDDCSKDNTIEIIKEAYGNRVQVHVNEKNLGAIKSFERAISFATGDILFLCDQDDIWEDNKVATVMKAFEEQRADLVIHDAIVVNGNLTVMNPSWNDYNHNNINQGIVGNIFKNAFTGAFMAFKKDLIPAILPFPAEIEMHDQWIALVCMKKKKKIVFIQEPLMKYVRHGGNVTGIKKRPLSAQLKGRLKMIKAIAGYKR
ncbi:glycosyltransferase family 2 protein [Bacillus sp. OK048]|uniref:glycosyltransferase family 2 protein n=1 Tax=Bacillus sp. OK048 TaxID=1882761 RepID=UPI00087DF940|nr:glycosyltransferase family 2 protein [Bacillus sp. OK048]SDM70217.1 Glycosyltransferase involved in cell wall bisynthesis [Bacillus sp. OK048]